MLLNIQRIGRIYTHAVQILLLLILPFSLSVKLLYQCTMKMKDLTEQFCYFDVLELEDQDKY